MKRAMSPLFGRASKVALLVMATLSPALAACSDPPAPPNADAGPTPGGLTPEQAARVVAKVGDKVITLGDYAAALDRMDQFDRLRYQSPERRRDLLKELVDIELLAAEARKRGLADEPKTQEALRQVLRDALLADVHKTLPSPAEIPAEEVKAYYDAHAADYREPERRRVSAIVLDDEKKAKDVLEAAKKADDATAWGKLFFESSTNAAQAKQANVPLDLAGDLGIVGPPDDAKGANPKVPEPVRAAVFKLDKVGQVFGEVVASDKKLYVVRLSGKTAGHDRTLAEADRQIRVLLLQEKTAALEKQLEEDLRKKYKIEVDDGVLSKLDVPLPADDATAAPATSASPATSPSSSSTPATSASAAASAKAPTRPPKP
jgi:hypothetical protein